MNKGKTLLHSLTLFKLYSLLSDAIFIPTDHILNIDSKDFELFKLFFDTSKNKNLLIAKNPRCSTYQDYLLEKLNERGINSHRSRVVIENIEYHLGDLDFINQDYYTLGSLFSYKIYEMLSKENYEIESRTFEIFSKRLNRYNRTHINFYDVDIALSTLVERGLVTKNKSNSIKRNVRNVYVDTSIRLNNFFYPSHYHVGRCIEKNLIDGCGFVEILKSLKVINRIDELSVLTKKDIDTLKSEKYYLGFLKQFENIISLDNDKMTLIIQQRQKRIQIVKSIMRLMPEIGISFISETVVQNLITSVPNFFTFFICFFLNKIVNETKIYKKFNNLTVDKIMFLIEKSYEPLLAISEQLTDMLNSGK